ncbi:hypothetical protein FHW84_001809 [Dyella sp. SG562]|uniref:hypothetical protein n=1 Tax=Dyella sp. SG562 TaxID=2587017 RepID=UPI0014241216|nr:hypothetical protein [Dyella sp. SG562]NII73240.1 hypothetical protein [Dyella sp. SG562]
MSGLRFKEGDLAIIAVVSEMHELRGRLCEVIAVGPWKHDEIAFGRPVNGGADYVVAVVGGFEGCIHDWQLRKLDPPAEPESITRREEVEA